MVKVKCDEMCEMFQEESDGWVSRQVDKLLWRVRVFVHMDGQLEIDI